MIWEQTNPIMPAGISCNKAANRKGKPFMKCRVAGYRELKRTLPTRKHKLSTQATAANRAPMRKKNYTYNYTTWRMELILFTKWTHNALLSFPDNSRGDIYTLYLDTIHFIPSSPSTMSGVRDNVLHCIGNRIVTCLVGMDPLTLTALT